MAALFLGKLLVAIGICFQAYLLFEDKTTATSFNSRLSTVLSSCDCIPAEIKVHLKEHLRLVVVALLGFSALMIFIRSCLVKIPVLLGLVTLFIVKYYPITAVPSFKDHAFWQLVATIGGIIYLMGADTCSPKSPAASKTTVPA